VTLGKCLIYGLRSDVASLPPIGPKSRRSSRAVYRATIAVLHFLQPFARTYGRLRGLVNAPASTRPRQHQQRPLGLSAIPAHFIRGVRLTLRQEVSTSFWSERWVDVDTIWSKVADCLRSQGAMGQIELDSGWWQNRDLTIVDRLRFRFDVRALVEDHGGGRCLHRFGIRLRLTAAAVLPWVAGITAVHLLYDAGVLPWPLGAALLALLALTVALANTMTTARAIVTVLTGTAVELGMSPIGADQEEAGRSATVGRDDEAGFGRGARGPLVGPALAVLTVVGPGELRHADADRRETAFPGRFHHGSGRVGS
jgi:hypothetical protein